MLRARDKLLLVLVTMTSFGWICMPASSSESGVDFEYAPPEWQTLICLPDDPIKSLVDHHGTLLCHYNQRGREFATLVSVKAVTGACQTGQSLLDPRTPIVVTTRQAGALRIREEAFAITGQPNVMPGLSRNDALLVSVTNDGTAEAEIQPELIVDSFYQIQKTSKRQLQINNHETVLCTHPVARITMEKDKSEIARMRLKPMQISVGETAQFATVYCAGTPIDRQPVTLDGVLHARDNAVAYWKQTGLPYGRVVIPDAGIQSLVDSSIRNIWQAREIKDGLPAFQVGPTMYRGLWVVDGAFLLETAAMLGMGDQARAGITYTLCKQKDTGAFEVLSPEYYKENGVVLWTCVRHARLTQDKDWLRSVWPQLEKAVAYIQTLRQRSSEEPEWLCHGLIPPGNIDGGLWNPQQGEYSNVYWNLLGLKAAIDAARWLGNMTQADAWRREYEGFYAAFRRAAQRDTHQDSFGNRYLPTIMQNIGNELPQRGQWAFCHGVYPGQLFEKDDQLAAGNLAMLAATEREGMVYGTGWDPEGIWSYFASFYGHAWLWQGNGQKANHVLYAFANHAAPMLIWREEQSLKGKPFRKVGDMPHNWASAEFIRLTTHLLALDRGSELHLLEGMPEAWAKPGMTTALQDVATPFGTLTFSLVISEEGHQAVLKVQPLSDPSCSKVVVHLGLWTGLATERVLELVPGKENNLIISLATVTPPPRLQTSNQPPSILIL